VTIGVIGFGRPLLVRWMGAAFEAGAVPLYVLALAGVVLVGQGPLGNILLGTGRHRLVAFVSLAEAIANLVLSVILVRRFGLVGVAIGTAVPIAIANLFVLLPAACRQVHVPLPRFLRLVLPAPLAGALPAIAVCVALRVWWPPATLAAILGEGSLVGLVYLIAVYLFGFDRELRARYLSYARGLLTPAPLASGTALEIAS
jgi:O-antigen/teichoic acid export membrane protein